VTISGNITSISSKNIVRYIQKTLINCGQPKRIFGNNVDIVTMAIFLEFGHYMSGANTDNERRHEGNGSSALQTNRFGAIDVG
jgi:hypothetical protein